MLFKVLERKEQMYGNCQARVQSSKVQSPKVKTKRTWADTKLTWATTLPTVKVRGKSLVYLINHITDELRTGLSYDYDYDVI